jgi:predicted DNA-binding transcriptional regulator AlpA
MEDTMSEQLSFPQSQTTSRPAFIGQRKLLERLGISQTCLRYLMRDVGFPEPVETRKRQRFYNYSAVNEWAMDALTGGRDISTNLTNKLTRYHNAFLQNGFVASPPSAVAPVVAPPISKLPAKRKGSVDRLIDRVQPSTRNQINIKVGDTDLARLEKYCAKRLDDRGGQLTPLMAVRRLMIEGLILAGF